MKPPHNKWLLSGFITLSFCLFVLPLNERIAFSLPIDRHSQIVAAGLKLLFGIFLYFSVLFIITFIYRIRSRDPDYVSWLKMSGIYFGILLVVFLLIYPGHWVDDEFNILAVVKSYGTYAWQNYFTNIFYTFCLYLLPTGVSIVLSQMVIISIVVGYIISRVRKLLVKPNLVYWLFVPFVLPPVLLNNLYPLRAALCSAFEILIIALILFHHYGILKKFSIYHELVLLAVLITLVSFWRSEGIYYLLLLPTLVVGYHLFSRRNLHRAAPYLTIFVCLGILIFGYLITKETSSPKYEFTAEINPLSTMLQQPLKGDHVQQRLAQMDQVVDINLVKQYPSYVEIPSFWKGAVRDNFWVHSTDFRKQYLYLVSHNLGLFFDNRIKVYLSTNALYDVPPASLGPLDEDNYSENTAAATFTAQNYLSKPLNTSLKRHVSDLLLCQKSNGTYIFCAHFLWNSIIPLGCLVGLGILNLIKRRYIWVGIIVMALVRVPLLFLTAPANYFFYYLPTYLIGYFLLALYLVLYFDTKEVGQWRKKLLGKWQLLSLRRKT